MIKTEAALPRGEVGGGYLPPALENLDTAFSDFGRKYLSNCLQFWEKIYINFSSNLGENITFFHTFSHFRKYPPPPFSSSRRLWTRKARKKRLGKHLIGNNCRNCNKKRLTKLKKKNIALACFVNIGMLSLLYTLI